MGFPRKLDLDLDLNKDANGNVNTTTWDWERLMFVESQKSFTRISHITLYAILCALFAAFTQRPIV